MNKNFWVWPSFKFTFVVGAFLAVPLQGMQPPCAHEETQAGEPCIDLRKSLFLPSATTDANTQQIAQKKRHKKMSLLYVCDHIVNGNRCGQAFKKMHLLTNHKKTHILQWHMMFK